MRGADRSGTGRRRLSPVHPLLRAAGRPAAPPEPAPGAGVAPAAPAEPRGPRLDGSGRPFLTLAQFLKSEDLAPTGGAAKHLVRGGGILVNGEAEDRPGRKLHDGDRVCIDGRELTVTVSGEPRS